MLGDMESKVISFVEGKVKTVAKVKTAITGMISSISQAFPFIVEREEDYSLHNNIYAGHMAILDGLRFCNSLNLKKFVIELDSVVALQIMEKKIKIPWQLNKITQQIAAEMQELDYTISHNFREGNQHANYVANVGCDEKLMFYRAVAYIVKYSLDPVGVDKETRLFSEFDFAAEVILRYNRNIAIGGTIAKPAPPTSAR
ncbi:hypothetical protein ACH5RR_012823 [Cinchona calisaya]|uniref:RNase H type-1 domain-containing protein n=1 Tax=Cinchona calisaya TaxID=153742 RepID=A0ABD3ACE4_9GENT